MLLDALIAEKFDGTVIIGRGIPPEWVSGGKEIKISNFPIAKERRMGYHIYL